MASLSGGQRQSVAVAKAVMWNSKVVLLDEPTAALGVVQTGMVLNLVRRLRDRGLAVMVISHNLNDVFQVADRIAILHLGRMVAEGPASRLRPPERDRVHDHRRTQDAGACGRGGRCQRHDHGGSLSHGPDRERGPDRGHRARPRRARWWI